MFWLLAAIYVALSALDVIVTKQRVATHGASIELNKLVRKCVEWFGPSKGAIIGIVPADLALLVLCGIFGLTHLLAFVAGARAMLALFQLYSVMTDGW